MAKAKTEKVVKSVKGAKITQDKPLEKLEGKTRIGDFVHNGQDMAKEEGFKNVSRLWQKKCLTFDEAYDKLEIHKKNNRDLYVYPYQFKATVDEERGTVGFIIDDVDAPQHIYALHGMTFNNLGYYFKNSINAIQDWLSPVKLSAKREYVPDMDDLQLVAQLVQNSIQKRMNHDEKVLIRLNDESNTIRCIRSDQYVRIDNEWVLDQYKQLIPGGLVSHLRGDSDSFLANVLIPDTLREEDDSDYGGMVSIGNCEIGSRALKWMEGLFRAICMNGNIWDHEKGAKSTVTHKRKGGEIDLGAIRKAMEESLNTQIPLTNLRISQMMTAKNITYKGDSVEPIFAELSSRMKIQQSPIRKVLDAYHEETSETTGLDKTAFSFINAVTRGAQAQGISDSQYESLNEVSGLMLEWDASAWDNLFVGARRWTTEKINKLFVTV